MQKFTIFFLIVFLVLPLMVFAKIGVGVATGKITVQEPFKPGGIYRVSPMTVLNTGDESSDYDIEVGYHFEQPQLRPSAEWFTFIPRPFHLEPGQSQSVEIKLTLPMKTTPGDYFAYLAAKPIIEKKPGTSIGVAASTQIYFTVVPANIWQGILYRVSSFFTNYAPWSWVVLGIVLAAIVIVLFKRFFAFQVGISKK